MSSLFSICRGVAISVPVIARIALRESPKLVQQVPIRHNHLQSQMKILPEELFGIRNMTLRDLPQVMQLRREIGVHDVETVLETWLKIDPNGMKVAVNELGEIVGACCFVKNSPELYVGGLYCVSKNQRKHNIGRPLYDEAYNGVRERNAIGNAVPCMVDKYRNSGDFLLTEDKFLGNKNWSTTPVQLSNLSAEIPDGVEIEPFQDCLLPNLLLYDSMLTGFSRDLLLELSCKERDSKTFVAFKNGSCVGFGSIKRSCLNSGRVGPLYADDPKVAEALLRTLIESFPDVSGFAMSTLSTNTEANEFVKKLGCTGFAQCIRIYKNEFVPVDTNRVFAHFDFNFAAV